MLSSMNPLVRSDPALTLNSELSHVNREETYNFFTASHSQYLNDKMGKSRRQLEKSEKYTQCLERHFSALGLFDDNNPFSDPLCWIMDKRSLSKVVGRIDPARYAQLERTLENQKPIGLDNAHIFDIAANGLKQFNLNKRMDLASTTGGTTIVQAPLNIAFLGAWKEISSAIEMRDPIEDYFPEILMPTAYGQFAINSPYSGMIQEYAYGTTPNKVQNIQQRVNQFSLPVYREEGAFYEDFLLYARDLGDKDLTRRSALAWIGWLMEKMIIRMRTRYRYMCHQVLYSNSYDYLDQTIYFGTVPEGNIFTPANGDWILWNGTSYQLNTSADPRLDLMLWTQGFYPNNSIIKVRQYLSRGAMFYDPWGYSALVSNPNVNQFIYPSQANERMMDLVQNRYADAKWVGCFLPLLGDVPQIAVDASWIPDSDVVYDSNGLFQYANAEYFMQPGFVFFGLNLDDVHGPDGKIGAFIYGSQIQNGGFKNPQAGPWLVLNDCTAPGTPGGPSQPYLSITSGFSGCPIIVNPNNIYKANVAGGGGPYGAMSPKMQKQLGFRKIIDPRNTLKKAA